METELVCINSQVLIFFKKRIYKIANRVDNQVPQNRGPRERALSKHSVFEILT